MTVQTFLENINKGHEKQKLEVYPKDPSSNLMLPGQQPAPIEAKPSNMKLKKSDRLKVTAEDGTQTYYQIFVKEVVAPTGDTTNNNGGGITIVVPTIEVPTIEVPTIEVPTINTEKVENID